MTITLTRDDKLQLGRITTRDEAGRHFTEVYGEDWLQRMEEAGYIQINRPVHEATGIAYSQEYWTVEVSPEVGEWFDEYGELIVYDAEEVVPRPGRLLREWRGYRLHADTDEDPNVLVIIDQDGNVARFDARDREWEDFDDLLALLVDDMDAGRLQWYEGE